VERRRQRQMCIRDRYSINTIGRNNKNSKLLNSTVKLFVVGLSRSYYRNKQNAKVLI
jgi:hypothetical protein